MKSTKLLVALVATGLVATSAFAQKSAFEGFYGQIATGYESNSVSSIGPSGYDSTDRISDSWNTSNQSFGGAPLVIGLGYNFTVAPKWVVGIGIDYSALSQQSSNFSSSYRNVSLNGQTIQISNRYNIFVTPGYELDKDKLVYLKAGYSGVSQKVNSANSVTVDTVTMTDSSVSQTKNLSGYVVGLGYKQMITSGLYGFAEFNYMSYSKANFSGNLDTTYSLTSNPSTTSYQALVGVGYKF